MRVIALLALIFGLTIQMLLDGQAFTHACTALVAALPQSVVVWHHHARIGGIGGKAGLWLASVLQWEFGVWS
jgi:hypothetical protein